jgi:two-component system, OmpR family, KDP operon response regulator KdpE
MTQRDIPILVIEDEPEIRKFLKASLESHDYGPVFAETAREGIKLITAHPPEVVILDLGLPDMDGLDVIRTVREWSAIPIIVLSARGQEKDKVTALELGADDYLTKPFGVPELLARLKVALRHGRQSASAISPVFEAGDLSVDLEKRQVKVKGEEIHLTPIEYKLLSVLVKHAGKVVTHQQLLKEVWGKNSTENSHYLRIYAQHLRQKLGDDPMRPRYIVTEAGVGYRFKF